MVLSVGYDATVPDAAAWQASNGLTYPVLSDFPGTPFGVTLQYTNFLGAPLLPWDAVVSVNRICEYTGDTYAGGDWNIEDVVNVFEALFDPTPATDQDFLDFGVVNAGNTAQRTVVVDNAGTGRLDISSITSNSPHYTPDVTQGQVYAVDDSLIITVTFDPLENYGQIDGVLSIVTPDSTVQIGMTALVPDAVGDNKGLPNSFDVACFPNPFNAGLTVSLELPRPEEIRVDLYNIRGDRVAEIYKGQAEGGVNEFRWADKDAPSGVYLVRAAGADWTRMQKVVLAR